MKRLIEIETGKIVSEEGFKKAHKNVMFGGGISEDVARSFGYSVILEDPKPEHEEVSHYIQLSAVEKRGGRWYQTWEVAKRPDADDRVRAKRNRLLAESDWVVVMHTENGTSIPAEWKTYRQELRDITDQSGFPYSVNWPKNPEGATNE